MSGSRSCRGAGCSSLKDAPGPPPPPSPSCPMPQPPSPGSGLSIDTPPSGPIEISLPSGVVNDVPPSTDTSVAPVSGSMPMVTSGPSSPPYLTSGESPFECWNCGSVAPSKSTDDPLPSVSVDDPSAFCSYCHCSKPFSSKLLTVREPSS